MNQEVTSLLRTFATSRRHFLRSSALAGGLMAAGGFAPSSVAGLALGQAAAAEGGDMGVLNYALTLEHLEDALYRALIDSGLLTGQRMSYARSYGAHEHTHVVALTDTIKKLGGKPVAEQTKYNFPKLTSEKAVVDTLVMVEDLGASAYLGAAPLIKSGDLLTVAVEIHTVEAYHATGWRLQQGKMAGNNATADSVPFAFAEGRSMQEVVKIVSPFLMSMPGTGAGGMSGGSSDTAKVVGLAGLGVAAAAGVGIARSRATVEEAE